MAEENVLESIADSAGLNLENMENVAKMGSDLIHKLSEKVEENVEEFNELKNEMSKIASDTITSANNAVSNIDCGFVGVINKAENKASEILGDIKCGIDGIADAVDRNTFEEVGGLEELKKTERRSESGNGNLDGIVSEFNELCKETVGDKLADDIDKIYQCGENVKEAICVGMKVEEGADQAAELLNETFEKFRKLNAEGNEQRTDVEEIDEAKLQNLKDEMDEKVGEINMRDGNIEIDGLNGNEKIVGVNEADNRTAKRDEFPEENSSENDFLGAGNILQGNTCKGVADELMMELKSNEEVQAIKKIISPGEDILKQDNDQLKGTEKTDENVKRAGEGVQEKSNPPENAVDVSEALSDPLDNNVTSPLQSLTSEDSLKFPKTLNAHEISIVKHSDRNEKKEPELQSTKTENSVHRSDSPNRAPAPSPETAGSLQPPVIPPKNIPPPVPPKKKSIEMILAEEAKAVRQRSLRGFGTSVEETKSSETEKDKLKSKDETKQNIETPTSVKQIHVATNKNDAKLEAIQKSESQKTHATALTQIQKVEEQKIKPPSIQPAKGVKPETAINEKSEMHTVKSKNDDGQQQLSRRCTIL